MTDTDDAAGHLQQARARLAERLSRLQREIRDVSEAIDGIDQVLRQIKREVPYLPNIATTMATPPRPTRSASGPGTGRAAILKLLQSEQRALRTGEIVDRASDFGTAVSQDTIRSLVSRMQRDG